jgi:two-component system phosphate regulon response regulator PhoB
MQRHPDSGERRTVQRQRVLIVEGDSHAAETLNAGLAQSGYTVQTLLPGQDPAKAIATHNPHLVILDWDLPAVVTMTLVRCATRSCGREEAPRLMAVSSHGGEEQISEGLDLGLDDYVIRPYSLPEVLARVRALLRPGTWERDSPRLLEFQGLRLEASEARVFIAGQRVHLRAMEYRLLEFLLRNPERAFSRSQLLDQAWGRERDADERAVDVTVQRIRKTLQSFAWSGYLQTVRGVGYRLSATADVP